MTDKNLNDFPEATTLLANDVFHINQGGIDKKAPASVVLQSIEGGNPFDVTSVEENSTARLVTLGDKDKFIQCLNTGGCSVTLPSFATAPFSINSQLTVKNDSIGTVNVLSEAGVTVRPSAGGLSLAPGEAATFIKVGREIWNMLSGGGAGGAKQRFKVFRTTDAERTGTGSAVDQIDGVLQVNGLTEGKTYKVESLLSMFVTTTGPATVLYKIFTAPNTTQLALGDYLTHTADITGVGVTVNNDQGVSSASNAIGGENFMNVRVSGEITIPTGGSSIALYWSPVDSGETVRLETGSILVVEEI